MFLRHYVGSERRKSSEYPIADARRPSTALDRIERNDELGVLSGIVDHVYVLLDSKSLAATEPLSTWLDENNVRDFTVIDVDKTDKYFRLCDIVPCGDGFNREYIDTWVGHYKAVTDAMNKGYEKIAVFEGAFNPKGLESALARLPIGFDIAVCTPGVGGFRPNPRIEAKSSQGYLVSGKIIAMLRRLFESTWDPTLETRKIDYVHKWLNHETMAKAKAFDRSN